MRLGSGYVLLFIMAERSEDIFAIRKCSFSASHVRFVEDLFTILQVNLHAIFQLWGYSSYRGIFMGHTHIFPICRCFGGTYAYNPHTQVF
jgi:hypothetical protein